jgi:signal transduction histidine kinase
MKFKVGLIPSPARLMPLLRGSPFAFPLAVIAALAMLLISEFSYQQATSRFEALGEQAMARTTIQTLWRSLTDAETGQRGYLLSGRTEYLRPYYDAQARVARSLSWLEAYYGEAADTEKLMGAVTLAARNKLSELSETIRMHDEGKEQAWRDLLLSNIGVEQMDTVRNYSEQLLAYETSRVDEGRRSIVQTLSLNRIGVSAMTAMCLLALFMYLRQTTALVNQREEQRRVVQGERDQFGHEVVRRTAQLTELARHLQTVREDERNRLARELHDELGALLTAAKLDVARLKSRLGAVTPEVAERLKHLSDGLNSGIALKRRIIEDLRPSSLSNLGLVAALEILVREWSDRTEIPVDGEFEAVRLRPSAELTVYRLVQEALTNTAKYAQATEVRVRLSSSAGRVHVLVRDNGVGFEVGAPRVSAHGLLGMSYRLETEGGLLVLDSAPGSGTVIEADLPESSDESTEQTAQPALA